MLTTTVKICHRIPTTSFILAIRASAKQSRLNWLQQIRFEGSKDTASSSYSEQPVQGLFGNVLLQTPRGFGLLNIAVESRCDQLVREIVLKTDERAAAAAESERQPTTVQLVDELSNEICCAADISDCVRCMHPDPEYQKDAESTVRHFTSLVERLNTTPELYHTLKCSLETEKRWLDPVSIRTAKLLLDDFENSGVLLADEARKHFVQLSDQIFEAGSHFMFNCDRPISLNADDKEKLGQPADELLGPWARHRDFGIRHFTQDKYFGHSHEQESTLKRLISARHHLAQLTNFPTFAHRAQPNSVLCTYENVHKFLRNTIQQFSNQIDVEMDQVRDIVQQNSTNFNPSTDRLGIIDVEFATMHSRHQSIDSSSLGLDGPSLNAYFTFGPILDGFKWLANRLYGLEFRQSMANPGECWLGNVIKLNVNRIENFGKNTFLGTIFLDIDARSSKMQGDCHFTVRCSKLLENGEFQTPIVVVSLAIVSSSTDLQTQLPWELLEKTQMGVQNAENFFHEMGHAMHSILGRTRFQHIAGTRCPTDFAEVPSHLMECFFNDPRILCKICRHNTTGQPLDNPQAEILIKSRRTFNAIHTVKQAAYALFDLELHGEKAAEIAGGQLTTTQLFGQITRQALPQLENSVDFAYHHRLSHLVTYGAKYYSYLVARASASLIYRRLFAANPFSAENGKKWAEVQSHGGEYPSDVLLTKALGSSTAPSLEQLIAVLVDSNNDVSAQEGMNK